MTATDINSRVQKHRERLRLAGLRPVQIWVPDTRNAGFAEECRRQCERVSQADANHEGLSQLLDQALEDLDGWTT